MTINKGFRADGGDIGTGRLREIADKPYGDEEKCWLAKRVLALLYELEAKDTRIAELEARALKVTFQRMPLDEMGSHRDGKKYSPSFGAGYNCAMIHCESEIREACAAAGISIKGK